MTSENKSFLRYVFGLKSNLLKTLYECIEHWTSYAATSRLNSFWHIHLQIDFDDV